MLMHVGYHGGTEGGHITLGGRQREVLWKIWENVTALEGNERKFLLAGTTLGTIVKWIKTISGTSSISDFNDFLSTSCVSRPQGDPMTQIPRDSSVAQHD